MVMIQSNLKKLENCRDSLVYLSQFYPDIEWRFKGTLQELNRLIKVFKETYLENTK